MPLKLMYPETEISVCQPQRDGLSHECTDSFCSLAKALRISTSISVVATAEVAHRSGHLVLLYRVQCASPSPLSPG